MAIDFSEYVCFDPGVDRPLDQVTRAEAKAHFNLVMEQKEERITQLKALVAKSGITLTGTDKSIQQLNDWFFKHVEPSPTDTDSLKPIWYSVVNDISLFLGELVIRRSEGKLRWELFTYGKRDVSYQRPVLMGFTKVKDKKYNRDLDLAIGMYGHRVISHEADDERDYFLQLIRTIIAYA